MQKIANLSHFCAKLAKNKNKTGKEKLLFKSNFLSYGVNLEDVDSVHPCLVCQSCLRNLYHLRSSSPTPKLKKLPFAWKPHNEENCVCQGHTKHRGRPTKQKAKQLKSDHDSDTESEKKKRMNRKKPHAVFTVRYHKISIFLTKNLIGEVPVQEHLLYLRFCLY